MKIEHKEKWIQDYASNLMSSYSAIKYEINCQNGWGDKEQYLDADEAFHLAEQALDRLLLVLTEEEKKYTPEEAYEELTKYASFSICKGDTVIDHIVDSHLKEILKQIK